MIKILKWIKINKLDISAFVMSGFRDFSYAEEALNLGDKRFFMKSMDIFSLIAVFGRKRLICYCSL